MGALERRLSEHLAAVGPIGFDEYQANALYAPDAGFYTGGGGAGRRRDFLTSPEVGPLFGAVVARALDRWWGELGRPDELTLIDAGAGPGTLVRSILAAGPRCAPALRPVLVEVGVGQWDTHPAGCTSQVELPEPGAIGAGPVVVLANELLDNLVVRLVERTATGWDEIVVGQRAGALRLERANLPAAQQRWCDERAPTAALGSRLPVQSEAAAWLASALALAGGGGGRIVVLDYARTSAEMAELPQEAWLRTYRAHGRGDHVLADPGGQDITCDVALDQLALVAPPTRTTSQATFLEEHGLATLVAEGRSRWEAGRSAGGLAAIAGRSRVHEAEALTAPEGLGGFSAIEWVVPAPGS